MKKGIHDCEHLIRAAILLCAGIALFLVIRSLLVPDDFGALGHYRESALLDNRARTFTYAGRAECEECHVDIAESRAGSKHERIACEGCHGALARHAEDPASVRPEKPDPENLCMTCHARNLARPATFPQVDREDHAGGEPCVSCHSPHHPEIE
jgi:hypothetical protein